MEIINAWVYDPSRPSLFGKGNKSEKSALITLHCAEHGNCDVFQKSQSCLLRSGLKSCKYGKKQLRSGLTQRASNFSRQILDWRKEFSAHIGTLKDLTGWHRVFRIGEYWYLPYAHMEKGVWGRGYPLESKWVPVADMNAELMSQILTARPIAEFGGEIRSYQQEVIPKFLTDLRTNYPELWAIVSDDQKERIVEIDHKGRRAILATCLPGQFGKWSWDGEYLRGPSNSFLPVKGEVIIKPSKGANMKITDNSVVGPDTKFAD